MANDKRETAAAEGGAKEAGTGIAAPNELSDDRLDKVAGGASNGISRLMVVTQMKAEDANSVRGEPYRNFEEDLK